MKKLSTHIMRFMTAGVFALALMMGTGTTAQAVGFNDAPSGDCPTFSIGNVTTGEGISSPCWNSANIGAKAGDTLNVKVYFHNTTTVAAPNASVRITDPGTAALTGAKYFAGDVRVNGNTVASGQGNVTLTGNVTFRLVKVTVQRQSTGGTITELPNPSSILSGNGISIGTVEPGWNGQGVVKAVFAIESAGGTTTGNSTVGTGSYSGYDSTNGNITLSGYASNVASVFFRYRLIGSGSWTSTATQSISNGNFTQALYGLPSGSYEYQACATNSAGETRCGLVNSTTTNTTFVQTFSITRNNINPGQCQPGYTWNGNTCVLTTCGTGYTLSGNTCVPIVCGTGYYLSGNTCVTYVPTCGTGYSLSGNTCVPITCGTGYTLSGNTCVQITCGTGYYLSGNTCVQVQTNTLPSASTLGTVNVGATVAAIDGYFNAYGCTAYTSFEYGTSQSNLDRQTNEVTRSGTGSMTQSLSSLSPNTTYFYRAVVRNCAGTTKGDIRSFTTGTNVVNDNVVIRTITRTIAATTNTGTVTGGNGSSFIKLMITNNREVVRSTKETTYDVAWENVSGRDLQNLVLEVNFPNQVTVIDTDRGSIKRDAHSVVYKIGDLAKAEKGDMSMVIDAAGNLEDGDPVVAQAILAFENPKTAATENAIAYDADEFSTRAGTDTSSVGASVFGLGFLPSSLAGWLLIILMLLIIALLVHAYLARQRQQHQVVATPIPAPVYDHVGASGNDYVVYRPNPKQ